MSHVPVQRQAERRPVNIPARCRTQSGLRDEGIVSDISPIGCRLAVRTLALRAGLRLTIRPRGLEGISGIVRWFDGRNAGVEFDSALYEPVVDHLTVLHPVHAEVYVPSR